MAIYKPNTKLSDICTKIGDGLHGTPNYDDEGEYYFINGNNLAGQIELNGSTNRVNKAEYSRYKKDLNDRTILISINGTLGNLAFYNGEQVVLGKSACYINISKEHLKEYIYYVLGSGKFKEYLTTNSTGSTIKNIGLKGIRNFHFYLPPVEEQKRIIDIIKPIEDSLKNINDQIFSIKNILVNNYNGCINDRKTFADYIELKYNKYANQEDYLATNAVGEFQIDFTKKQNVLDVRPSRANLTPVKDSIIISKLDGENKIVYIDDNFKYVVSTGFYNFKTKYLDHVVGFLLSEDFKKQKTLLSTGTTMVGLNNDSLNKIIFNKPDSENKQFTLQLNNLINMQVGLIQQRDRMIELLIK